MALTSGPGGKEVGRLSLKVVPDTSGFGQKLQAFADRMEKTVEVELPVTLKFEKVSDDLQRLQAQMDASPVAVDIATEIDGTGARREVSALEKELETTSAIDVDTHLDTLSTLRQMRTHLAALEALALANRPTIRPDIDGTRSRLQMIALLAQLKGMSMAGSGVGGAGEFGKNVALWGPLIFAAAAGIAAIGPALAALIPLALGFAGSIGVILLSLKQLKETFGPLWTALKGMSDAVGPALVAGLQPFVSLMTSKFIPVLQEGLVALASVMNLGIRSILGFLTSAEGLQVVGDFFKALAPALTPFAAALGPITEAILRLAIEATPALQMMGDAILGAVTGFNSWIQGATAASTISESMSMLGDLLKVTGQLIAELFPPLFAVAPAVIAMISGAVDVFGALMTVMQPLFEWMSRNATVMKIIGAVLIGVLAVVAAVAAATVVWSVVAASTATLIGAAIGGIVGFLIFAWRRFEGFRNFMTGVWDVVVAGFNMLLSVGKVVFDALAAAVTWLAGVFSAGFGKLVSFGKTLGAGLAAVFGVVGAVLRTFWAVAQVVFAAFMAYAKVWWTVMSTAFSIVAGAVRVLIAVFQLVWAVVSVFFTPFIALVKVWWAVITAAFRVAAAVVGVAIAAIIVYLRLWWNIIKVVFAGVKSAVKALSPVWSGLRAIVAAVVSAVVSRVRAFLTGVKVVFSAISGAISGLIGRWKAMQSSVATAINGVTEKVRGVRSKVQSALSGAGTWLVNAGRELIRGLISGITSMIGNVGSAMGGIASKIKRFLPGSPVREGPLTSWNNGGAGIRLMSLLADGVSTGSSRAIAEFQSVTSQMEAMANQLNFAPTLEGLSSKFDVGQLDVTQAGSNRLLLQMTDWDSGKGVMREVSETAYAGRAGVETTRALMGGN